MTTSIYRVMPWSLDFLKKALLLFTLLISFSPLHSESYRLDLSFSNRTVYFSQVWDNKEPSPIFNNLTSMEDFIPGNFSASFDLYFDSGFLVGFHAKYDNLLRVRSGLGAGFENDLFLIFGGLQAGGLFFDEESVNNDLNIGIFTEVAFSLFHTLYIEMRGSTIGFLKDISEPDSFSQNEFFVELGYQSKNVFFSIDGGYNDFNEKRGLILFRNFNYYLSMNLYGFSPYTFLGMGISLSWESQNKTLNKKSVTIDFPRLGVFFSVISSDKIDFDLGINVVPIIFSLDSSWTPTSSLNFALGIDFGMTVNLGNRSEWRPQRIKRNESGRG